MLVDIVKRTKVMDPETKRERTMRELSCGHTQVQSHGGKAQSAMFARCQTCAAEGKPLPLFEVLGVLKAEKPGPEMPTELERLHTPMK